MKSFLCQLFIILLVACGVIVAAVICVDSVGYSLVSEYGFLSAMGFSNSGLAGGFVSLSLVAVVGMLLSDRKVVVERAIFLMIAAIFCVALILSDSRAAWLAATSGMALLIYGRIKVGVRHTRLLAKPRYHKQKRIIALVAVALFLIPLAAWLYLYRPTSANGRLLIWRVCLRMISDRPIFGYGPNGLVRNYMLYQADFFKSHPCSAFVTYADNNVYAFNELLHILVDWGIVGSMAIGYLVFSKLSAKSSSSGNVILKSVLVAWLVFGIFSYPFSQAPFFIIFWICCLLLESRNDKKVIRTLVNVILSLAMLIGTSWFILCGSLDRKIDRLFESGGKYSKNEFLFQSENWQMRCCPLIQGRYVAFCEMHIGNEPELKENIVMLRETAILNSAKSLPMFGIYCAAGDILARKDRYDEAISYYAKASSMIPLRLRPRYQMFLIMLNQGQYEDARKIGEEILNLPIKVRSSDAVRIIDDVKRRL